MATSLHVLASLHALPGQENELKTVLLTLIEPTRAEAGCIRYELWQSQLTPTEFVFVEEWESEADEQRHLQSAHVQQAFLEGQPLLAAPATIHPYRLLA
jgi:quinol monooxygenase YgiN